MRFIRIELRHHDLKCPLQYLAQPVFLNSLYIRPCAPKCAAVCVSHDVTDGECIDARAPYSNSDATRKDKDAILGFRVQRLGRDMRVSIIDWDEIEIIALVQ